MAKKDWSILLKRQVFTTASSAEAYALPNDFDHFIDNTHWNLTNQDPMIGPITVQRRQTDQSGIVAVSIYDKFIIKADGNENRYTVQVNGSAPTSAENISFYYITDRWCRSAGNERQNEWKADTDVLLLDDFVYELGLKWRLLRMMGRSFADEEEEYNTELKRAFARDGGMPNLHITQPLGTVFGDSRFNIPDTGFG